MLSRLNNSILTARQFLFGSLCLAMHFSCIAENQLIGLHDASLSIDGPAGSDFIVTIPFCVQLETGSSYRIKISSTITEGRRYKLAELTDNSQRITATYYLNDDPSTRGNRVRPNRAFRGSNASNTPHCADTGFNANINVRIDDRHALRSAAGIYSDDIILELYNANGSTLLATESIAVTLKREPEFHIRSTGDIFLRNTTDTQLFETFCIGLVPASTAKNQRYRISVQGSHPSVDQGSWQLANGAGDNIEYRLRWIERGRARNPTLTPQNTTAVFRIHRNDALDNIASLKTDGSCAKVQEGFEFRLRNTAMGAGVYNDVLTVTVAAQ